MAKFIFQMQNLLNIKYKLEEQKKAAFGLAKKKLDEAIYIMELLNQQKSSYEDKLRMSIVDTISVPEVKRNQEAIKIIKMKMEHQKILVKQAQRQVELATIALREAMKERKTYEKLREKAFDVFKQEMQKEESKEVDELVSFQFGKAKGEMISYGKEK